VYLIVIFWKRKNFNCDKKEYKYLVFVWIDGYKSRIRWNHDKKSL